MDQPMMPRGLVDEVCDALGVAIPSDRATLELLATTWSAQVPFDPVAKLVALRHGGRPPGDDPVAVVERWLATGIGSTCWGHSTALGAILDHAGIHTSIGLDRMLTDEVVDFHSFLLADVDGERFLIDPIHPTGSLLPFEPGATGDHPQYQVGLELDGGRLVHWFGPAEDRHRYVVLATDLDRADARAFLAVSVQHSGVRGRFFSHRVLTDARVQVRSTDDGAALTRTVSRCEPERLSLDDVDATLAAIGYRPAARAVIRDAGMLEPASATPWLALAPNTIESH